MAKIKVAIYDADKGYRERFVDYLMSYKSEEMDLSVFTGGEYFLKALDVDKYHLLVLGCGYEEVLQRVSALTVPILVLAEHIQSYVNESIEMTDEQIVYTSKYQSMDVITKRMQLMTEVKQMRGTPVMLHRTLEVIGIFSPIKHEMQMLYSLLYTKNAARTEKVLYLNLLEFSGFSELFGETEYDLGDAILQIRDKRRNAADLRNCIYEKEEFSYLSPFSNPENIREVTAEDVQGLLSVIADYTDYQKVIIDIGIGAMGLIEALLVCSKLYCLEKRGYLFQIQITQFLNCLEKMAGSAFLERIERLEVPHQAKVVSGGSNLLEQLNWTEFGDFVRSRM